MGKVSWALYANQQNTSVLLDRYQYPFPMTSDMRDKIVTRTCQMFPMYGCKTIVRNQCPVWNIQLRNDLCSNKLIYSWHREFEDLLGFFFWTKKKDGAWKLWHENICNARNCYKCVTFVKSLKILRSLWDCIDSYLINFSD